MERHTIQKELVYSALVTLHNHPTADQIYDSIHTEHPRISKATVYRILRNMAARGEIRCIPVADGADRFDHTKVSHFHILCNRCGAVEDIFEPELDALIRASGEGTSFRLLGYELLFRGLCPACAAKEENCLPDTTV